jgi:hypothetical protein
VVVWPAQISGSTNPNPFLTPGESSEDGNVWYQWDCSTTCSGPIAQLTPAAPGVYTAVGYVDTGYGPDPRPRSAPVTITITPVAPS